MDKVIGTESVVISHQQLTKCDHGTKATPSPCPVADVIPSDSDQPIDMSLSSRKRALSPSKEKDNDSDHSTPVMMKKSRPAEAEKDNKRKRKPLRSLTANKKSRSALIISPEEYSDEGINNHFRRSLSKYYTLTAKQMGVTEREVDGHFLRALGWDVWWNIHRQAKPQQHSPIRAHTPEGKNSTPPL